tara:strand:- start:4058 stop:4204 length:147 start_codon:yes stop_codon:yes gene_type:complete
MDKQNYLEMKRIVFSLDEYLNTPNEDLERMIGMNWYAFHKLKHRLSLE